MVDLGIGIAVVSVVLAAIALWIGVPAYRRERASTSVETFRSIRRDLHGRRASHTTGAASLFAADDRLEHTAYMSAPAWRLSKPISLSDVNVTFVQQPKRPQITGRSSSAAHLLPSVVGTSRTRSYSDVIGSDDQLRPGLWWDAPSYDLLSFVGTDGRVEISCTSAQYFDMVDVCEAVGHEYVHNRGEKVVPKRRSLRFRSEIGDPFDIGRRPFVPAIPTLVLLQPAGGPATFLLHARDGAAVASASGLKHVFGGQFQPSSRHSIDHAEEADIWLAVARELAEEMLDFKEANGSAGGRLSFADEPLASLDSMRRDGHLKVWLLGLGLDPLTLWPDLLTVAVIDDEVFRRRFPELPTSNSEGVFVGASSNGKELRGFDFVQSRVDAITADDGTHPAAAACIRLAWKHRAMILGDAVTGPGVSGP
jgi:hypothetical protein